MVSLSKKQPESSKKNIPFIDLKSQQDKIRLQINQAINEVLNHGKYIMGPEISELEKNLAEYCKVKNVITCSSGTDALIMALMSKGIGNGDAVFVPSFTFTATPEVVALLGATPIFVDVLPQTFNIDPESVIQGISVAKSKGLKPKTIIAVDLFGQPADYTSLEKIAEDHNLWILADAAQSFGGVLNKKKVGKLACLTATSFFPAKPLGCYGDGGALLTDNDELANILKSIRVHGKGEHKYDNIRVGLNARLDTIQAAVLIEKMKIFDAELKERQVVADYYNKTLKQFVEIPSIIDEAKSAWAQYTIKLPDMVNRESFISFLKSFGIPSVVYYAKPLHLQSAYKNFPTAGSLSESERLSKIVLSLPINHQESEYISNTIKDFFKKKI